MKHLDLWYYWLRDKVGRGTIESMYLQMDDMAADLLTKSLPKPKVEKVRENGSGFIEKGVCWIKGVLDCESVLSRWCVGL